MTLARINLLFQARANLPPVRFRHDEIPFLKLVLVPPLAEKFACCSVREQPR